MLQADTLRGKGTRRGFSYACPGSDRQTTASMPVHFASKGSKCFIALKASNEASGSGRLPEPLLERDGFASVRLAFNGIVSDKAQI